MQKKSSISMLVPVIPQVLGTYVDIQKYKKDGLSYENFVSSMFEKGAVISASLITNSLFAVNKGYPDLFSATTLDKGAAWIVSGIGVAYVAQLIADKTKGLEIKHFQKKMSNMYGIQFKLDDFHDSSVSSLHLQAHLANKIMSTLPFIGKKNWKSATNNMIGFGIKYYKKIRNVLNQDIKDVLSRKKSANNIKRDDLKKSNEEYNKNQPKHIQEFISKLYDFYNEDNNEINNYLLKSSKESLGSNNGNYLEMNNDLNLKDLNTIAINNAYHKTMVQSVQLSFVRLLRIYAQEYVSQAEYPHGHIKNPTKKLKKLDKELKLFARLYEETIEKSSKHKINEYKVFKDFYENKNMLSKNNFAVIDAIANEKFEETTQRIDKELSNGKTINIITFQDAFMHYRDKYIQSSQFGLNNDSYQKNNIKRHKTNVSYTEINESLLEIARIKSTEGKIKLYKNKI